jgi:hypothetical protein
MLKHGQHWRRSLQGQAVGQKLGAILNRLDLLFLTPTELPPIIHPSYALHLIDGFLDHRDTPTPV